MDMIRISRAKRELAEAKAGKAEAASTKAVETTRAAPEKAPAKSRKSARSKKPGTDAIVTGSIATSKTSDAAPKAGTSAKTRAAGKSGVRALIARHAAAKGVPLELAEAVVKVESNFNPKARSRSGAVGLMQILPRTARASASRDRWPSSTSRKPISTGG
ncbi:lytic murein transglycosylase [Methylobrevis pamukkalensis]|uniref:Lytic murein transglycosylase n=1 Tax=Methylobrevis pamukkalensis TaxID=1439726 RepID=A0A1E3GY41_9HYPH|nr:lytic murein transglycosylase [Methylobrevis pamukkalensis]